MRDAKLLAQAIVEDLIEEMVGRAGLDGAWDSIDEETKEELLNQWREIVERHVTPLCRQADRGSRIEFPDTTGK